MPDFLKPAHLCGDEMRCGILGADFRIAGFGAIHARFDAFQAHVPPPCSEGEKVGHGGGWFGGWLAAGKPQDAAQDVAGASQPARVQEAWPGGSLSGWWARSSDASAWRAKEEHSILETEIGTCASPSQDAGLHGALLSGWWGQGNAKAAVQSGAPMSLSAGMPALSIHCCHRKPNACRPPSAISLSLSLSLFLSRSHFLFIIFYISSRRDRGMMHVFSGA